jgi:ribonuclease HI
MTQSQACWTAPSLGWVKANWDASIESQKGLVGCAVVVWDHLGKMMVAKCTTRKGYPTPLMAEALATIMVVRLCKEMGLQQVHFEGDAKTIVDAMNSRVENRSSLGMVLEDLRQELQTLVSWKISYIKRERNNAAHVLAKFAIKNDLEKVWVHPPDCIREQFLLELFALAA